MAIVVATVGQGMVVIVLTRVEIDRQVHIEPLETTVVAVVVDDVVVIATVVIQRQWLTHSQPHHGHHHRLLQPTITTTVVIRRHDCMVVDVPSTEEGYRMWGNRWGGRCGGRGSVPSQTTTREDLGGRRRGDKG